MDTICAVSEIDTEHGGCLHRCDKDLAHCVLTCDNQQTIDHDINVCEHTCFIYKEYCVAYCFH